MTDIRIDPIGNTKYYWGKLGPLSVIVAPDEYANGAKLAKSAGKKLGGWLRSKSAQSYMADLAEVTGNHITSFSYEISSGPREIWGTYLHPDLIIQLANWCSNKYGLLVTRVMREYHGKEATKLLAAREAELAARDVEIATFQKKVKKKDNTITELRAMMARMEKNLTKNHRKTHAKLGVISDELGEVKDDLAVVSGKLGVAKQQRVPPAKRKTTEHESVLLRHNRKESEVESSKEDSSEDSEQVKSHRQPRYDYSLLRVQNGNLENCIANKRRVYPNLEVIKKWNTPNSMNIWHRYREEYGHRIESSCNNFSLNGGYSERRMIRHINRVVESRLAEEDLE